MSWLNLDPSTYCFYSSIGPPCRNDSLIFFTQKKRSDLVLLSRRWYPSELRFSDFEEMVVSEGEEETISYLGYSLDHLIERVSQVSGIPPEHVRIAKVNVSVAL